MRRKRGGQFIILASTIILLIIIVLVASIHQSQTAPQSPPPIYPALASVGQSLQAVLISSLAYFSHQEIATQGCGTQNTSTPSQNSPMQTLFDQLLENITYIYSAYGLQIKQTEPTYIVAWCTGPSGAGSTAIEASFKFNLTGLGLYGYADTLTYSLDANSAGCTTSGGSLTCNITVDEDGEPLVGLNQSYFYLSANDGAWQQAAQAIGQPNGTYTLNWPVSVIGPSQVTVAVEDRFGVYVLIYSQAG